MLRNVRLFRPSVATPPPKYVPPKPPTRRLVLMAAKTVENVVINQNGSIQVNFPDGSGASFPNAAAVAADSRVAAVGSDDWMIGLLLARWLGLNPQLNNPADINGTTLEVITSSVNNPVTFSQG